MPVPTLYVLYLGLCQIVLYFVHLGDLNYVYASYWSTGAYRRYYSQISLAYLVLTCFYALSVVGIRKVNPRKSFQNLGNFSINPLIILILTIVLVLCQIIHLCFLDWEIVWSNSVYQMMQDPEMLTTDNPLVTLIASTQRLAALAAAVLGVFCLTREHKAAGAILLALTAWQVIFMFAAHSREATFLLGALTFVTYVLSRKKRPALVTSLGLATTLSLLVALAGRGYGHHGLLSITDTWDILFGNHFKMGNLPEFAFMNFFEGIYSFSEHFAADINFPQAYKMVSISPFPSFIDGYPSIRDRYMDKLSPSTPRSALDEIMQFGPSYMAVYFGAQAIAIRLAMRALRARPGFAALAINLLLFTSLFLQTTYGVRLVFRSILIVIVIASILARPAFLSFRFDRRTRYQPATSKL